MCLMCVLMCILMCAGLHLLAFICPHLRHRVTRQNLDIQEENAEIFKKSTCSSIGQSI
jgi:hypothetical protein